MSTHKVGRDVLRTPNLIGLVSFFLFSALLFPNSFPTLKCNRWCTASRPRALPRNQQGGTKKKIELLNLPGKRSSKEQGITTLNSECFFSPRTPESQQHQRRSQEKEKGGNQLRVLVPSLFAQTFKNAPPAPGMNEFRRQFQRWKRYGATSQPTRDTNKTRTTVRQ